MCVCLSVCYHIIISTIQLYVQTKVQADNLSKVLMSTILKTCMVQMLWHHFFTVAVSSAVPVALSFDNKAF